MARHVEDCSLFSSCSACGWMKWITSLYACSDRKQVSKPVGASRSEPHTMFLSIYLSIYLAIYCGFQSPCNKRSKSGCKILTNQISVYARVRTQANLIGHCFHPLFEGDCIKRPNGLWPCGFMAYGLVALSSTFALLGIIAFCSY